MEHFYHLDPRIKPARNGECGRNLDAEGKKKEIWRWLVKEHKRGRVRMELVEYLNLLDQKKVNGEGTWMSRDGAKISVR